MGDPDQMSFGSIISLRSVSEGAPLESARSTQKRKPKKASGSPYGTPKKTLPKKHVKKTGREVWINSIQNGAGMSAESGGMNTWAYGKPGNLNAKSSATPFLMEQFNMTSTGKQRPSSATARVGGSGPVYKDAESYYDEIQDLKRIQKHLKTELDLSKAQNNRLQDELVAKSRKIDELLNPETQNNDLRRTLGSKKPDASEVVMSLRRKIHKLEEGLRSKENELRKTNSELKVTNIEELKYENEMYLNEIHRLNSMLQDSQHIGRANGVSEEAINDALRDGKGKKTQILIKRLTEDNHSLVLENKSLKNDLMKLTTPVPTETLNLEKDYEDMNRQELLQKLINLEQRLKEEESNTGPKEKYGEEEVDQELIDDRCIELKGPLPQQIKQLRSREKELLSDVERLENSVKKLKEDRSHYRKMTDDYRQQLEQMESSGTTKTTKESTENLSDTASIKSEKSIKSAKKKSSSLTPRKQSTVKASNADTPRSSRRESSRDRDIKKRAEDLQEQNAAKKIQRGWRSRPKKVTAGEDEDELEDAIVSIQSAWRGHQTRQQYLETVQQENDALHDDDVLLIQSAFRGHSARKDYLNKSNSRSIRSTKRHSREIEADQRDPIISGEESDDDDDVVIGSSVSLSNYRDHGRNRQMKSRNPKIYSDPDATHSSRDRPRANARNETYSRESNRRDERDRRNDPYQERDRRNDPYQERDRRNDPYEERGRRSQEGSRRNDLSEFVNDNDDDDEERVREELSSRFRHNDDELKSNKVSIGKLKSSSTPWTNQKHEIETDEDSLNASRGSSRGSSKARDKRRESQQSRKDVLERENVELQDKWARSGSSKNSKKSPVYPPALAFRKSTQLRRDFQGELHDSEDDDDDDDDIIAPTFQQRFSKKVTKRAGLDDELF